MKKNTKKKSTKAKSRLLGVALITTLILGGTASQAKAIDILKTISDVKKQADSFLYSIKSNPAISKILGEINQIATIFLPQIQQFTNISNADINKIKGVLNILAPSETQQAIDTKEKASATPSVIPSQSQAARASASTAAEMTLSKEAQEADRKNLEEISNLVQESTEAASTSAGKADEAESASSSQDVLKILANQNSSQAAINAAQLRLLALQNNNLQAIKTQLAVANQANANTEGRIQGETQERILRAQERMIANMQEMSRKYRIGQ